MLSPHIRALFVAFALAPGLAQCDRAEHEPAALPPPAPAAAPGPVAALGRSDLIGILSRAASAHAAGEPNPGETLTGRRFVVRLPFGCEGPDETAAPPVPGLARWRRISEGRDIELRLEPADWLAAPPAGEPAVLAEAWAGVEGFWIARPWLMLETCPPEPNPPPRMDPAPIPAGEAAPPPPLRVVMADRPTAGLAAYTPQGASRIGRREGRPYVHVVRGEADAPASRPSRGWRVLLEGRVGAFPDGRSVRCRAEGPEQRPVCVAAVQVDKVAFEEAPGGRRLAEWRPAG